MGGDESPQSRITWAAHSRSAGLSDRRSVRPSQRLFRSKLPNLIFRPRDKSEAFSTTHVAMIGFLSDSLSVSGQHYFENCPFS